jgi:GNAT superfamily N-acetyltransferase
MSLAFVYTRADDPLARPLIEELSFEYDSRYGEFYERTGEPREMQKYGPEVFSPQEGGNFLLLLDGGRAVSGGAFKRLDIVTAEFKRVWTHSARRREGLARRVLVELEAQAWRQGYRSVYLTTGFRQPEAAGLYRTHGYAELGDPDADPATVRRLAFRKALADPGLPLRPDVRSPAAAARELRA